MWAGGQVSYVTDHGTSIDAWALTGIGQWGAAPDEEPVVLDDTETGQQLRAGIWYPRGADGRRLDSSASVPVVVLVHGGGWSNGDRLNPMTRGQADWLSRQGYLAIAVDYPLSTPDLATGSSPSPAPPAPWRGWGRTPASTAGTPAASPWSGTPPAGTWPWR